MPLCLQCGEEFTPYRSTQKYCGYFCKRAYQYLRSVGRDEFIERTSKGRWINSKTGYVTVKHNGRLDYEHRVIAEKALGKPLPPGAVVHHTGAPDDNHGFFKLVICPNQDYHMMIHSRMKALGYENN